jgi:hypothetical protein
MGPFLSVYLKLAQPYLAELADDLISLVGLTALGDSVSSFGGYFERAFREQ